MLPTHSDPQLLNLLCAGQPLPSVSPMIKHFLLEDNFLAGRWPVPYTEGHRFFTHGGLDR